MIPNPGRFVYPYPIHMVGSFSCKQLCAKSREICLSLSHTHGRFFFLQTVVCQIQGNLSILIPYTWWVLFLANSCVPNPGKFVYPYPIHMVGSFSCQIQGNLSILIPYTWYILFLAKCCVHMMELNQCYF